MLKKYNLLLACMAFAGIATAGNPDRQGEAGAYELLINPWARSAGLNSMNTAYVSGAEAMFNNVAGISRVLGTEVALGHTRYLVGADLNINALGFTTKMGKSGVLGIQLMAVDFGDIDLTTEGTPGGSGATFSPSFFNLGLSYAKMFENKVSVGITVKSVNESITNVSASGIALDAGVQYVAGKNDRFKFGISLRNIGGSMTFSGEGLTVPRPNPDGTFNFNLPYYNRSAGFELPSQLNIGASYDWPMGKDSRLTVMGNFTSNAFSRDNLGGGVEFAIGKTIALRAGYKHEFQGDDPTLKASLDNGLSAGITFAVPLKKEKDTRLNFDLGFRKTEIYRNIFNFAVRLNL